MRIIVPEKVKALADIIAPYIVMNNDGSMLVLKDDASDDVRKAKA